MVLSVWHPAVAAVATGQVCWRERAQDQKTGSMALLLSPTISFHPSASARRTRTLSTSTAASASRLHSENLALPQYHLNGVFIPMHLSYAKKRLVLAHASKENGGEDAAEGVPETPEPAVSIENMPLESKQQMILEQRMRMKQAKKLRRRRKRLVRKRQLRKKGRWPPSKMRKLKNV